MPDIFPRKLRYAVLLCLVFAHAAPAQSTDSLFQPKMFTHSGNQSMPYRLFVPKGSNDTLKYPLVLWLHGANGRGTDNIRNISAANTIGSHVWTTSANQQKFPCFVVAPQCPETTLWVSNDGIDVPTDLLDAVVELIRALHRTYAIDTTRIYVAGQSMGGVAVWEIIARYPSMFAAALPLCAIGNTENAKTLTRTPVWAFHGAVDEVVPVAHAREMISAITYAGGSPKYSEYKSVGHDVWNVAFKERGLLKWVFSQRKK